MNSKWSHRTNSSKVQRNRKWLGNGLLAASVILVAATVWFAARQPALPVSGGQSTEVKVPVLMYHSILDNTKRVGKYVITPESFEQDLVYLKDNGFTTVQTKDLINYVKNGEPLPDKPIVITFDDGYFNNYSYLFPVLKKYDMKAVLSIVGTYTDQFSKEGEPQNNNYTHITWDEIKEVHDSGLIEIQNHTYNLHDLSKRKGILRKKGEDFAHYKEMLINDISLVQDKVQQKTGVAPTAFTYPFGAVNKESQEIVDSLGFEATYSCQEGVNVVSRGDPSCLLQLKRYNRAGDADRNKFFEKIFRQLD